MDVEKLRKLAKQDTISLDEAVEVMNALASLLARVEKLERVAEAARDLPDLWAAACEMDEPISELESALADLDGGNG